MQSPEELVEHLRRVFVLRDGALFWRGCASNRVKNGARAGALNSNGYRRMEVAGRKLYEHQCIFAMTHGRMPIGVIDHVNGDKSDNRPENLREGTQGQNLQNQRAATKRNLVGLLGVSPKRNKYRAQIKVNRKPVNLGVFETPEQAHAAYLVAKRRLHPFSTI